MARKGHQGAAGAETLGDGGDVMAVCVLPTLRLSLSYIIISILTLVTIIVVSISSVLVAQ